MNSADANSDRGIKDKERAMLRWALIFAVISLIAGLFGFTGIASDAAGIAKILFGLFLALFLIFLVFGITVAKKISS